MMGPVKVGITGGIGAGKTVVSTIFSKLGAPVYNADERAKALTNTHPEIIASVKELFGPGAFVSGQLNRTFVASKVFNDPKLLKSLNKVIHPVVGKDFKDWCNRNIGANYVIKEAALLFETGSYKELDVLITVTAPEDIRTERVLKRDPHRDEQQVKDIMARQMSQSEKAAMSDYVINNDGKALIIPVLLDIHKKLLNATLLKDTL